MKKSKTNVAIVLDRSGSMNHLAEDVRKMYNNIVESMQATSGSDHDTTLSLITFATDVTVDLMPTHISRVPTLTKFPTGGQTALFDGVGKAIQVLEDEERCTKIYGDDDAYLLNVLTDGEENWSSKLNATKIKVAFDRLDRTGKWTMTFNLPYGRKANFVRQFGISPDNVREWEQTTQGVRETETKTSGGVSTYFAARSAGVKSVKDFYKEVNVDLAAVKTVDVKSALTDIHRNFKTFKVEKEEPIKEFVQRVTGGKDYVIGSAFYQLTKKEEVQSTKKVLLKPKGSNEIYGGNEARNILGLPTDGTKAKVNPLDLSKWDVFISSTSVNRKLVRGTAVLVDTTKTTSDPATWTMPTPTT